MKKVTFEIRVLDKHGKYNDTETVTGYHLDNPVLPEFPLVVYKYKDVWTAGDYKSGQRICACPNCNNTRSYIIESVCYRLREYIKVRGEDKVRKTFSQAKRINT